MNTVFIIVADSQISLESAMNMGGVPFYCVTFKTFSAEGRKAVDTLVGANPLFTKVAEELESHLIVGTTYTSPSLLKYSEFVDLIEAYYALLQNQKNITVKRFKLYREALSYIGSKLKIEALPPGKTFNYLLESYEGETDLYDSSFAKYAWDLLQENNLLDTTLEREENND